MKAIIMAGGEGTRLRPLTCDCPKPMIKLMNRPVMQYALTLLKSHGITQIAATLGYLPDAVTDYFGGGDDFGVDLRYYIEKTPLGTAGGVRQAMEFLDETFIVLSGDGVTDLDITAAAAFHRSRGALATLVLRHADNPLDYGVVLTDARGRVLSFHEKPDWSDVVSDTINTGIYILEPEALERVPGDRPWDFGHDLFPALVRQGLPVYGYVTQDYWCDVGDVRAYLAAHIDAMEGRIRLDGLLPRSGRVAQLPGASVDRSAVLEGPCLIGQNARVLPGAYVGPYSVIGPDCVIGECASVKRAVLWPGARLERGAQARGCVLAAGARLGESAQAYEESVLGTDASIGERAVLLPGVKLWPGKCGGDGERLEANLVWGGRPSADFKGGALLIASPAQALRAAQAVAAAFKPGQLLLGRA
ncbi:MAG: NDP-sugar synthase, partial [Clostridia bacterium]|nr:NDP-sugar synthase [Clostridia bacterium]